jgi:Arc/MetJ-type ribon-helix-helix transcriptional regulator
MKVTLAMTVCMLLTGLPAPAEMTLEEVRTKPTAEVEAGLPSAHPAMYYIYALRLFEESRKDDAVFWFYTGQLRHRFHLSANPDLLPDEDPALLASLMQGAGEVINEYAGGDPTVWVAQIERALKWDAETRNDFTSKDRFTKQWEAVRGGLQELKSWIAQNTDKIGREREKAKQAEEREKRDPETDEEAQARTIRDIRSVATAMFSWLSDHAGDGETPYLPSKTADLRQYSSISHKELVEILVPDYLKSVPANDGWGHPLEFYLDTEAPWTPQVIAIRSPGKDGKFSALVYDAGSFPQDQSEEDIVWANELFIREPRKPGEM